MLQSLLNKTVKRHCSCLGFRVPVSGLRVPVFCNAPQILVMCHVFFCNVSVHYTTCLGWGRAHYEKSGALQKTCTHNSQTGAWNPKQEQCLLPASPLTSVSSHPVSVWVSVIVMSLCYDYVIVMFHFFAKLLNKINIFYIYISILCTYISNLSSNIIFEKEKFWKVAHSLWKVANSPTMIC